MKKQTLFVGLFLAQLLPKLSLAAATDIVYHPLAPIAGFIDGDITISPEGLTAYLNTVFRFGIALAGLLAVIMIIWGGLEYLSTDAINGKSEGKKKIQEAFQGLALALLSWLILYTINPQILSTNLTIEKIQAKNPVTGGTGNGLQELTAEEIRNAQVENGYASSTYGQPFTPVAGDPAAFPGIANYTGSYTATDNSGRSGAISGTIQYLKDTIPTQYSCLEPTSTYRSPEHNAEVGGSGTSDHLTGKAIDFHKAPNADQACFEAQGKALVDYMVANGRTISVDQVIFQDMNYRSSGTGWSRGGAVSGHYDHVHIGLE